MSEPEQPVFSVGDLVVKDRGDYVYAGEVRSVVVKRSGQVRYVVENGAGMLMIFSASQLARSA